MPNQARKRRGFARERNVADWFKRHGFPFATAVGGKPGRDILNMIGLAPEVKARGDYSPTAWLRQADDNAECTKHGPKCEVLAHRDLPFVIHCPNGYGPARIAEWVVSIRLDDFTDLLREAGYGEPKDAN